MIALHANVLVRYLVQDDAEQFKIAAELIGGLHRRGPRVHLSGSHD
jgi:predicted nucleic-acid-binding protein